MRVRSTIARLFGRSPFLSLQTHMDKVAACVAKIPVIMEAFLRGERDTVEAMAEEISRLEHQADLVKNDIRNNLPKGTYLAVHRSSLLDILSSQDNLADLAENIGVLLTLKSTKLPEAFRPTFKAFLDKNIEAFEAVRLVIGQLDELLETGFSGAEANLVKKMVDDVALKEHEADVLQRDLLKKLFAHEDELSHGDFHLWSRIFREVAGLSNESEKLANRVRMTLEPR